MEICKECGKPVGLSIRESMEYLEKVHGIKKTKPTIINWVNNIGYVYKGHWYCNKSELDEIANLCKKGDYGFIQNIKALRKLL